MSAKRVGIIGGRGHTGAELIRLIAGHPQLELAFVSSRELNDQRVSDHVPEYTGDLRYSSTELETIPAQDTDAIVLALPNGKALDYVNAITAKNPECVIVDLSADYRFDNTWYYGLPELTRRDYDGQRRISNPGCYATAMQLAIAPLKGDLAAPPSCFGVSGYSGAGTTPSDRNDPEKLRDNLIPYSLTDHMHEREVSRHLGIPVEFVPHVAPHFRGITMTVNLWLDRSVSVDAVKNKYVDFYKSEPLIKIVGDAPWVSNIAGKNGAEIGGFSVAPGGKRAVIVATLDNLLKGAATQALQNLNMALGLSEFAGISHD
jgi:N-acetyl-gamma-glutamyl-phosphate reductase